MMKILAVVVIVAVIAAATWVFFLREGEPECSYRKIPS